MGKILSKNKIDNADNISNIDNIIDVDSCAICLNVVKQTSKDATVLECKHSYHTECINVWLSEKNTCPYCMQTTTYKPKVANEIKKETVITIINNNVQNRNRNNNRNNKYKFFKKFCINKDSFFVLLSMISLIANIINIALVSVVSETINNNYINTYNNTNTTECIEKNTQDNIYISCVPDYIIQGIYSFLIFAMPGFFGIKNKYIYFTIIFGSFIISYGLNLYRFVTFNKYLDIMKNINYCMDVNNSIKIEKLLLMIEIIVLGICLPLFIVFNVFEYFYRKNNRN